MGRAASVIVRARNAAATIERTLWSLRHQSVPVQIILVDSGSTDATLRVAGGYVDDLVELPSADFTYGRALNRGAALASCDVHVVLSAHCAPLDDRWVERSLQHYSDRRVAATNGATRSPRGELLQAPYHQRPADIRVDPSWGFSNHAGSWRAAAWQDEPFREDLDACEDKEWSWRLLSEGWSIAYDPDLVVPSDHRRLAGPRSLWRRVERECRVLADLGFLPPPTYRELARRWWQELPPDSHRPAAVQRVSPYRALELHAAFRGARRSASHRKGRTQDDRGDGPGAARRPAPGRGAPAGCAEASQGGGPTPLGGPPHRD